jgi:hypothetical protein
MSNNTFPLSEKLEKKMVDCRLSSLTKTLAPSSGLLKPNFLKEKEKKCVYSVYSPPQFRVSYCKSLSVKLDGSSNQSVL